ncbi:diguanylate cyclase DgcJ [Entomohabitans teleogrylli]|uniref:diguanylate cyclase DgcJ n=1 Tax=Entomohabitans teleogrylli TaxID=1384589 RepID=UPI00073D8E04|nr:diguanylate cyclase DgcJ [Entomohabitans teleogrylli]
MSTQYRLTRILISCGVVVLTSSFLIHFLLQEHRSMKKYMSYIVEKGTTSLIYEKYINQNLSVTLMHAFSSQRENNPLPNDPLLSQTVEHQDQLWGINLSGRGSSLLHGTLQSQTPDFSPWLADIPGLRALDNEIVEDRKPYGLNSSGAISDGKLHYYVDMEHHYIYFYTPVDSRQFIFRNWLIFNSPNIRLSPGAIAAMDHGDTVTTNIYRDDLTGRPIMTLLSPVYWLGKLKGVIAVDLSKAALINVFYTQDRPLLWKYLNVDVVDAAGMGRIEVNRSASSLFGYVAHRQALSPDTDVVLSLDVMYFILTSYQLFLPYIFATLALLYLVQNHFRHHYTITRENITDAMTGLYNRKVLSARLESRLNQYVARNVPVTFVAIDCDGLKVINDTLGHKAGDSAITLLARAIQASVRKSDYPVRLGGDEFGIVLIGYDIHKSAEIVKRIRIKVTLTDERKLVNFSWGAYAMQPNDTLEHAYQEADMRLYQNKSQKKTSRDEV